MAAGLLGEAGVGAGAADHDEAAVRELLCHLEQQLGALVFMQRANP
jgi:hypothetical protein